MFVLPNKHACAILRHAEMLGNTKVFLRVRRHMPKRTTYLLRWSEEQQSYEMMGGLPIPRFRSRQVLNGWPG
jgi:hypothetical protein